MCGDMRHVYRILVGNLKGKRHLGMCRHRWEDNNKMGFKGIGSGGVNWI
jgi:hypothetical protein